MNTIYQLQYLEGTTRGVWLNSTDLLDEKTAKSLIRDKLQEYCGQGPTRRVVKITKEVMTVGVDVFFTGVFDVKEK